MRRIFYMTFLSFLLIPSFSAAEGFSIPNYVKGDSTWIWICDKPVDTPTNSYASIGGCVGPIAKTPGSQDYQVGVLQATQWLLWAQLRDIEKHLQTLRKTYAPVDDSQNPIVAELRALREDINENTNAKLEEIVSSVETQINALPADLMADKEIYQNLRDRIIQDLLRNYKIEPK